MYTRFITSNGRSIFAPLVDENERMKLKQELDGNAYQLFCGCSSFDEPLLYGISSDLRFIPLHKNYVHKPWCSRFNSSKRTAPAVYDENGLVYAYTSFAVNSFSMPAKVKEESELTEAELRIRRLREEERMKEKARKEALGLTKDGESGDKESLPSFNLSGLVRFLNHDAYMLRVAEGKYAFLSEEYFLSSINAYLKKVTLDGMKKPLKDLSLEADKTQFFYNKVSGLLDKSIQYQGYDGTVRNRYVPEGILTRAEEAFEKTYGIDLRSYLSSGSVYAAGFMYERMNQMGKQYRCVGRLLFFPVTENGLYVDSLLEKDVVEMLMRACKKYKCQFSYPDDTSGNVVGVIRNLETLKEAPVFLKVKRKGFQGIHLALHGEVPSWQLVESLMKLLK